MQVRQPDHAREHGVSIERWSCIAAVARANTPAHGFPDDRVAPHLKGSPNGRRH